MEPLGLRFLGDIEVVRAGERLALPPSRKTRALLAYLALNERGFRRDHLCELLWEVPDDPRGSLRWSLSKLRRLVDGPDGNRILADRVHVELDTTGVAIDVRELHALVNAGLDDQPLAALEHAAERYAGHFLEGLELSNFYEFHAWWVAEREAATRAQAQLLRALIRRLASDPVRALVHAHALVTLTPYDEQARAELIGLLIALGRRSEAEQQYALGARLLREAGARPTGTLSRALQGSAAPGVPDAAGAPAPTAVTADARAPADTSAERAAIPAADAVVDIAAGGGETVPATQAAADTLVGRDDEMRRLAAAFAEVRARGHCAFLLLRGDPGIGKTRLLAAAAGIAEAAGARVLDSVAFESEAIRPFAIWLDALRRHSPAAADAIFGGGSSDNRERLLAGLSDFVSTGCRSAPIALIFDDVQWCDESSAAALHYVARTNRQRPLFGVIAARETELRDNAAMQQALQGLRHAGLLTEIRVRPLAEEAVRALIAEHAPDADSLRLSRECGGNPLFAIELARAELSGDSGSSLDELITERLNRFDAESADVLHWAAVLAPRIDVGRLEQLTEFDTGRISLALELAERQAMLLPAERGFRFSHDLVARSVYADISPARRRLMHRRIAELLEQDTAIDLEHASDLAHHASQSGDAALAGRAMVSAGRLCLRFFANDEAASLARRGLALVGHLPDRDRICLQIDLEDICLAAVPLADWEAAAQRYTGLAEQALDLGAMSHARLGYYMASFVRWMHGSWTGAREGILQAERVSRGGSEEDQVVGMAEAARCLALLDRDFAQADAMLMEAQALASRKRLVHHSLPIALGLLRFRENRLEDAEEFFQEARTLAKQAGDRITEFQANEHLVMIDIERGRFAAAKARCATLLEIGMRLREGSEEPFARALDAICDYALDEETPALDAAFETLRRVDAKQRLTYALLRAAMLDTERGRHARALARAAEALRYAEALDRATDIVLAHVVLADASRLADDREAFARHARSIEAVDRSSIAEWARERAAGVLAAGGEQ